MKDTVSFCGFSIPAQVTPFAFFMLMIGLEEIPRLLGAAAAPATGIAAVALYPVKTLGTLLLLVALRRHYRELDFRELRQPAATLVSVVVGVAVFLLWIRMDWGFATVGQSAGYDPNRFGAWGPWLAAVRLFGAAAVVPVMEELFWRSFLLRYLIAADFKQVPIGTFTWPSFLLGTIFFGLEHNLYLAGMMAGAAYSLILYRTKSLAQCVLCHAVTNLALGVYVLLTGQWQFW